jgi:nucleotide-binding universal stress UspA family protein
MIGKIFVPLDGSELSSSILPFAAGLAKPLSASILLFHAVVPPVLAYPGVGPIGFDARLLHNLQAAAREFLTSVAADLTAQGVETKIIVSIGNAADAIIAAADEQEAGLIAMSTHGRSGLGRLVMGSVADAVVRRTSIPVLLVGPKHDERD